MPSASKWVSAACVSVRNLALGGSFASLSLLGKPRTLFEYATESLFLYQSLAGKRGIPENSSSKFCRETGSMNSPSPIFNVKKDG